MGKRKNILEPLFGNIALSSLVAGDTLSEDNRFLNEDNTELIFPKTHNFHKYVGPVTHQNSACPGNYIIYMTRMTAEKDVLKRT